MVAALFMLSDFVVGVLVIMGGTKLAFQQSEPRATTFVPGMGLVLLGVLAIAFTRKAIRKVRWLYLPRVLVYLGLLVLLIGAFLQNWFQRNGAVAVGDWQLLLIGGVFLFSNAVGYGVWARQG
jgi:hypothetical protein